MQPYSAAPGQTVKQIRILTYKRTHTGDPDPLGRFGIHDCMGRVRSLRFDAVIGVGGTGQEPQRSGIARKLTWIGIRPRRIFWGAGRAELVEFEHFVLLDAGGPDLDAVAPRLAALMYGRHRRFVLDAYPEAAYQEALALLEMARRPKAPGDASKHARTARCRPLKMTVRKCSPRSAAPACRRAPPSRPGASCPPQPASVLKNA